MPSFYLRRCIIKISRPEHSAASPLIDSIACSARHTTHCPMAIAACVLMITYTMYTIMCSLTFSSKRETAQILIYRFSQG